MSGTPGGLVQNTTLCSSEITPQDLAHASQDQLIQLILKQQEMLKQLTSHTIVTPLSPPKSPLDSTGLTSPERTQNGSDRLSVSSTSAIDALSHPRTPTAPQSPYSAGIFSPLGPKSPLSSPQLSLSVHKPSISGLIESREAEKRQASVQEAINHMYELEQQGWPFKSIIRAVIEEAYRLLQCDRVSLFIVHNGEMFQVVSRESFNWRFQVGRGIAGRVALTGESVMVDDAYLNPNFDKNFDKRTGYRTKSMLCVPIIDVNPYGDSDYAYGNPSSGSITGSTSAVAGSSLSTYQSSNSSGSNGASVSTVMGNSEGEQRKSGSMSWSRASIAMVTAGDTDFVNIDEGQNNTSTAMLNTDNDSNRTVPSDLLKANTSNANRIASANANSSTTDTLPTSSGKKKKSVPVLAVIQCINKLRSNKSRTHDGMPMISSPTAGRRSSMPNNPPLAGEACSSPSSSSELSPDENPDNSCNINNTSNSDANYRRSDNTSDSSNNNKPLASSSSYTPSTSHTTEDNGEAFVPLDLEEVVPFTKDDEAILRDLCERLVYIIRRCMLSAILSSMDEQASSLMLEYSNERTETPNLKSSISSSAVQSTTSATTPRHTTSMSGVSRASSMPVVLETDDIFSNTPTRGRSGTVGATPIHPRNQTIGLTTPTLSSTSSSALASPPTRPDSVLTTAPSSSPSSSPGPSNNTESNTLSGPIIIVDPAVTSSSSSLPRTSPADACSNIGGNGSGNGSNTLDDIGADRNGSLETSDSFYMLCEIPSSTSPGTTQPGLGNLDSSTATTPRASPMPAPVLGHLGRPATLTTRLPSGHIRKRSYTGESYLALEGLAAAARHTLSISNGSNAATDEGLSSGEGASLLTSPNSRVGSRPSHRREKSYVKVLAALEENDSTNGSPVVSPVNTNNNKNKPVSSDVHSSTVGESVIPPSLAPSSSSRGSINFDRLPTLPASSDIPMFSTVTQSSTSLSSSSSPSLSASEPTAVASNTSSVTSSSLTLSSSSTHAPSSAAVTNTATTASASSTTTISVSAGQPHNTSADDESQDSLSSLATIAPSRGTNSSISNSSSNKNTDNNNKSGEDSMNRAPSLSSFARPSLAITDDGLYNTIDEQERNKLIQFQDELRSTSLVRKLADTLDEVGNVDDAKMNIDQKQKDTSAKEHPSQDKTASPIVSSGNLSNVSGLPLALNRTPTKTTTTITTNSSARSSNNNTPSSLPALNNKHNLSINTNINSPVLGRQISDRNISAFTINSSSSTGISTGGYNGGRERSSSTSSTSSHLVNYSDNSTDGHRSRFDSFRVSRSVISLPHSSQNHLYLDDNIRRLLADDVNAASTHTNGDYNNASLRDSQTTHGSTQNYSIDMKERSLGDDDDDGKGNHSFDLAGGSDGEDDDDGEAFIGYIGADVVYTQIVQGNTGYPYIVKDKGSTGITTLAFPTSTTNASMSAFKPPRSNSGSNVGSIPNELNSNNNNTEDSLLDRDEASRISLTSFAQPSFVMPQGTRTTSTGANVGMTDIAGGNIGMTTDSLSPVSMGVPSSHEGVGYPAFGLTPRQGSVVASIDDGNATNDNNITNTSHVVTRDRSSSGVMMTPSHHSSTYIANVASQQATSLLYGGYGMDEKQLANMLQDEAKRNKEYAQQVRRLRWPRDVEVCISLSDIREPTFNIFNYKLDELVVGLYRVLVDLGFKQEVNLDDDRVLQNFILAVRSNYRNNPFHNFVHGFHVFQFCFFMLFHSDMVSVLETSRPGDAMFPTDYANLHGSISNNANGGGGSSSGSNAGRSFTPLSATFMQSKRRSMTMGAAHLNLSVSSSTTGGGLGSRRGNPIYTDPQTVANILKNHYSCLSRLELFCLLIASLCHDLDHPGTNNQYQINTSSPLALLHNDQSVLENHHATMTFTLLRNPKLNVFRNVRPDQQRVVRKTIVNAILATDMSHHMDTTKQLGTVDSPLSLDLKSDKDKSFLFGVIIHTSDLCAQTLPQPSAGEWERRINEEFRKQAEDEERLGLPVAPFMQNLDKTHVRAQSQVNFIDFVLAPWWRNLVRLFPALQMCADTLQENRAYYEGIYKRELEAFKKKEAEEAAAADISEDMVSPANSPSSSPSSPSSPSSSFSPTSSSPSSSASNKIPTPTSQNKIGKN